MVLSFWASHQNIHVLHEKSVVIHVVEENTHTFHVSPDAPGKGGAEMYLPLYYFYYKIYFLK